MKQFGLKRILSLLCVFALMAGMVSTSALAAVPMTGEVVAEIPVMEAAPARVESARVDVEPEQPAAQVGAVSAPTYDEELPAELFAAVPAAGETLDCTKLTAANEGTQQSGSFLVTYGGSPKVVTEGLRFGGATKASELPNRSIQFELSGTAKVTVAWQAMAGSGEGIVIWDNAGTEKGKSDLSTGKGTATATIDLAAGTYYLGTVKKPAIKTITVTYSCDHNWGTGEETTSATCTTKGVKTFTCSLCGGTKTEDIAMKAHSYTTKVSDEVPATCYQDGATAVMKCATCTATQGGEAITTRPAHSFDATTGKCTTPGCTAVDPTKCQHTSQTTVAHKDATCTEPGVKGGSYCADCGEGKAAAEEVIPALNHKFENGVCVNPGCGAKETTGFISEGGWLESAYATWAPAAGATSYTATVKNETTGKVDNVDKELIRGYPGYMRVDVLGLTAGNYTITVTDNNGKSMTTNTLEVKAQERTGYAFAGGNIPGAYKMDGTLKDGARVIYVTNANKDSVTLSVLVGKNEETRTGLMNIIGGYTKQTETRPLAIRLVGKVDPPSGLNKGVCYVQGGNNITIEGVGNDAAIKDWGLLVKGSTNVELRNIGLVNCSGGDGDCIGIEQTNDHIWVHNCDFFYATAGGDADQNKGDGALDIKKTEYTTLSYNHFWDCGKTSLLGNAADVNYATYHHNWFDHSDSRHPRVRGAQTHVYNNYYDGVAKYGVGSAVGAPIFVEGNYFRNTRFPMISGKMAHDIQENGKSTLSGEAGGVIKAWNNTIVGAEGFTSYQENSSNFDAYVATSRDENIPSSVAGPGGSYNNFDTASDFYSYTAEEPAQAMITVTKYAGRVQGGDFQWDFDNAAEDSNYGIIADLKAAVVAYEGKVVSHDGQVTAASASGEHTCVAGASKVTTTPTCKVAGEETRYCTICGKIMGTTKIPAAHSNDGSGECQVCHEKVANSSGPASNPNSKILKHTDFAAPASDAGEPITKDMISKVADGYFTVTDETSVLRRYNGKATTVNAYIQLNKNGKSGIQFTVKNGTAEVKVQYASTSDGQTSYLLLAKDGVAVSPAEGATSASGGLKAPVTATYQLPAGTYVISADGSKYDSTVSTSAYNVRLLQVSVSEAEATEPECVHTSRAEEPAVPATCETAGSIQHWVCEECGKCFDAAEGGNELTEAQLVVPAKQHSYGAWTMVNGDGHKRVCANDPTHVETAAHTEATRTKGETTATCTTPGSYTEETYCTVCNGILKSEDKTNVLAPHKLDTKTEAVAATCVAEGNIEYWTCSVCHKNFSDAAGKTEVATVTQPVDGTAHGEKKLEGQKDATTTEEGYTGDLVCTLCNKVVTKGEVISKIEGSMSKLFKSSDQDASATVKGWKDAGTDVSKNSPAWGAGKSAKMGGNDTVTDFFTVNYGEKSKIDVSEPTKTWDEEGNYYATEANATRVNFGATYGSKTKSAYTIGFTTEKAATVKVWWVQGGNYHDDAKNKDYPVRNMQILNSAFTQVTKSNETATTSAKNDPEFSELKLTAGGTYYLCGETGTNYIFMVEVIEEGDIARAWPKPTTPVDPNPPAPCIHATKTHTAAVAAECEKAGNIEYWTCSECGKKFSDEACTTEVADVTVAAKQHDMQQTAAAVPATCKAEGKTAVLECANGCGKTEGGAAVAKLPHTEATRQINVTTATCTTPGDYDEQTYCSVCDEVIKTEHKTGVTLPHDLKEVPGTAVAPTATEPGKEADKKCANCDYKETGKVIPATGEEPVVVDKAALTEAIKKAEAAKSTATVSVDGSDISTSAKWVTEAEMKALTDAIEAAKAVEKKADATQTEVDGQVTALNKAVTDFEAAKKNGTKSSGGSIGGGGGGVIYRPSKQETLDDEKTPLAGGPELNSKDHMAYITGYPDGTVGAERNITRQEAAAIFYRLLTEQSKAVYGSDKNDFADIGADHWANSAISTLANAGIIKGLPDGTFGAEQTITRAEFVTMAARFYTVTADQENPFPDVAGNWAEKEILFAYSKGWVKGLPDGSFGPDKQITRAEAMRIINNVLERAVDAKGVTEGAKEFSDVSESDWYYYDVVEATNGHTYTRRGADAALEDWKDLTK